MNGAHSEVSLHRIDVNLLVAFDTLAREKNVTRAALRVGVSQSAMSHTLRRLRELFDDPLLVRGRGGMVLTPRGEALVVPIRTGLSTLSRALTEPMTFDPSTARRAFRIASPDLFDALALPRLLARMAKDAPGVDLIIVPTQARLSPGLETGDVDLAITAVLLESDAIDIGSETAPDLKRQVLFRDSFRCFFRRGHPSLSRRKPSLRAFASLPHVLVSPRGEGPGLVDAVLAEHGLTRRIAVRVPHFASALSAVHASDLVLTAPSALAEVPLGQSLGSCSPPISLKEHAITMVWHPRFSEDPGHRWLRRLLVDEVGTPRRRRRGRTTR